MDGEVELPCKTEAMDVWCDGGNGEDSGVEVVRAASCGSSVLSGYSEAEGASECGSETYPTANTVKALAAQLNQQLDLNETGSESSSTHETPSSSRISSRSKKPSMTESKMEGRKSETKPKVPAKPASLKPTPRSRKSEPPKPKPSDNDGRWPFSSSRPAKPRATSAADPARKSGPSSLIVTSQHLMTSSFGPSSLNPMTASFGRSSPTDGRSSALEMYGTLPRRKKKEVVDRPSSPGMTRSNSREPSLNRAATLRRQTSREKDTPPSKSLPPYPRGRRPPTPKTLILHETGVQTALTGADLDMKVPIRSSGLINHTGAQTDITGRSDNIVRVSKEYVTILERMGRLLGYNSSRELTVAVIDDVEKHVADMSKTIIKQREEMYELETFSAAVKRDLEKSQSTCRDLAAQQKALEEEQEELQDFLQMEKTMLTESLADANEEVSRLKEELKAKDKELAEQQNQCIHSVRLAEQRRQENLSLEARLAGLEQRSQDVMRQQGAAVSGAAVALTSLGARLDSLVDQLAVSYNVADKDLEDVIFHNEAYSPEGSPDIPEAPTTCKERPNRPRKATSFLSAVLGAIRSATQSPPSDRSRKLSSTTPITSPDPISDSIGLLDSEITFDGLPKSSEEDTSGDPASASILNLSAAILQRQRTEEEEENACRSLDTSLPPDLNSLVDQVILVDNLVTKLLKVMRIVQVDNDTCLDEIADQRAELDDRLRLESESRLEAEKRLLRVESELQEARSQLTARIKQLEDAKTLLTETWQRESQRQYSTIDHALETLQGMQDVVDQFPPLVKLQQRLEDCNFQTAAGDDLNANNSNGNVNNTNGS